MAFEKINIGTIANDGTGDSPRSVGTKMNAIIDFLNGSYANHFVTHNSNVVATENQFLFIDTSSNPVQVSLPTIVSLSLPSVGVSVTVIDVAGTFNTNNCTVITTDAEKIDRVASPFVNATQNSNIKFVYSGATYGWVQGV